MHTFAVKDLLVAPDGLFDRLHDHSASGSMLRAGFDLTPEFLHRTSDRATQRAILCEVSLASCSQFSNRNVRPRL